MKRQDAAFPVGILPPDVASSLRNCMEEIAHCEEAYEGFFAAHKNDYNEETSLRIDMLSRDIGFARAGLQGCVMAILAQDEEAKRHA